MKFVDFLSYIGFALIASAGFGWLILGGSPVVSFMFWAGVVLLVGIIVFAFLAVGWYLWQRGGF